MRQSILSLVASLLVAAAATTITHAFTTPQLSHQRQYTTTSTTALQGIIRADDVDLDVDLGQGGVRLAEESAIKVTGDVKHKPGSATPEPMELVRYTQCREIPEARIQQLQDHLRIVCVGRGVEDFKDPGATTIKEVTLGPMDAVRDATMNSLGTAQDADKLVINFLGGNDLQLMEVIDAVRQMVLNLDAKTSSKISFNSLCHKSFPLQRAYLTVVALKNSAGEDDDTLRGEDRSWSEGEVYFQDGKYFTVVKEDISTAVA